MGESNNQPQWLEISNVLKVQEAVTVQSGDVSGIRDMGLLESATMRPKNSFFYENNTNIHDLAALYTEGIAKNHPFVGGNKRTALISAEMFLADNGFALDPNFSSEFVDTVDGIAAGTHSRSDLASLYERASVKLEDAFDNKIQKKLENAVEALGGLSKNSGQIAGTVIAVGAGGLALASGSSPAEAAEIVYEGAVPYGETQIDLARGDLEAAEHSAIVETASTVGSGVGAAAGIGLGVLAGAAYGSVVPGVGTVVGAVTGLVLSAGGGMGAGWLTEKFLDAAGEKNAENKADAAQEHSMQEHSMQADKLLTRDKLARMPVTEDMPPELAHLVETQAYLTRAEKTGDEAKIDTAQNWYNNARQVAMDSAYLPDVLQYAKTHSPDDAPAPNTAADWKPASTAAPVAAFALSAP